MVFVWIPPGSFMMGSPDDEVGRFPNEGPVHQVTVSGFWLARHPVTFGQWRTVMDVGAARSMAPSRPKTKEEEQREATQAAVLAAKADYPVEDVLWPQAQEFIQKLCLLGGIEARMRLPTEAEWEYAARAGETGRFPGDGNGRDRLDDYAWYSSNSTGKLQRIGKKKPNAWGLHDMLGNVWEWALDGYGAYSAGPVTDPQGNADASEHARRGGSYRSNNKACRFARRNPVPVDELEVKNSGGIGFRVARDGP
jgi:formylglycine-generating enzyme required for sulfatase activity